MNDKKIDEVLKILPQNSQFYFVKPSISRGCHPKDYEELLKNTKIKYKIFDDVNSGFLSASNCCSEGEMIFVGGSNFIVGEFLEKNQ